VSRPRTRVLFVTGWGRSGSTLLDVLLGQVPGLFSAGELVFLWSRGIAAGWTCGCGSHVQACPVWSEVLTDAYTTPAQELAPRMQELERRLIRTRHLPALLAPSLRSLKRSEPFAEYAGNLATLYESLARVTGSSVIVDSSKLPSYAAALCSIETLDVSVVHLVRDPRAVAYSWSSGASNPGSIERMGIARSSLYWNLFNAGAEALERRVGGRYLRLRYEDLVEDPPAAFERVLALAGVSADRLPFSGPRSASVSPTHTVSGNPARFRTGSIDIAEDDRWRRGMTTAEKRLVAMMTLPLLLRYGYSPRLAEAHRAPQRVCT
jgi:hypothetical protein